MAESQGEEKGRIRPVEGAGRWESEEGKVELVASRCLSCGEVIFPERPVCPRCTSKSLEAIRLAGPAKLNNFTVIHQLPQGFKAPMLGGYGEFREGVQVFAPIDAAEGDLKLGMMLELYEGVTRVEPNGDQLVSFRYRPAAE